MPRSRSRSSVSLYVAHSCDCAGSASVALSIELLNQLGILWSNRSLYVRALCFFQACQKACAIALDGVLADAEALAGIYTHTHFYLAQIYGNLQLPDESARYCLRTLELQLSSVLSASGGKASAVEWMANCLRLVDYYLDTSNVRDASSCLFACECVYSKTYPTQEESSDAVDEEEIENQQRTRAEIASGWAKVHQLTLQLAQFPDQIKLDPSQTQSLERILCDNGFGSLVTSSVVLGMQYIAPQNVNSFDDARDVFKQGTRAIDQAKVFFVLDGFVTEHVRLQLLQSRLYKRLVHWESDQKRQIAMELRRMAIVTPLLGDHLNPSAYTALLQEVYFEGAEIASEVYDLKQKKSEKRDEKTNSYALKAIHCYQQYLRLFYSPPPASVTGGNNVRLPSNEMTPGEMRTLLLGYFALARMCGKVYFPKDKEKTLSCWSSSLGFHEAVPALVQKYQDLQSNAGTTNGLVLKQMFEGELAICREMMELLPEKINQLAYNDRAVLA